MSDGEVSEPVQVLPQSDGVVTEPSWISRLSEVSKLVEGVCAILLVLITGFYTNAAYKQAASADKSAMAAKTAADAAKSAADTAASQFKEMKSSDTASGTQFKTQLNRIDASIEVATRQASAAEQLAQNSAASLQEATALAQASQRLADATDRSAKELSLSLASSNANFITEQRPYVILSPDSFVLSPDRTTLSVTIHVANHGRSAALKTRTEFMIIMGPPQTVGLTMERYFSHPKPMRTDFSRAAIPPNESDLGHGAITVSTKPVDAILLNHTLQTAGTVALVGRAEYVDYADHPHRTTLCVWRASDGLPQYCKDNNDMQ